MTKIPKREHCCLHCFERHSTEQLPLRALNNAKTRALLSSVHQPEHGRADSNEANISTGTNSERNLGNATFCEEMP